MDYRVELDVFHGPLDLLLYLVKRSEVDLRDIPVHRITEQYLQYLTVLQMIDVEDAGEFVVMAGTLIELKSKIVLPRNEEQKAAEEEDPRQELVRQLLEHKRFKDAATILEEQAVKQSQRHARRPPPPTTRSGPSPLQPVELWDLVSAFGRLLRETLTDDSQEIVADQTPIHVHMEMITERLAENGSLTFRAVFTPPHTRSRLVGIFLAVLQLAREMKIRTEQEHQNAEILIHPALEQPDAIELNDAENGSSDPT